MKISEELAEARYYTYENEKFVGVDLEVNIGDKKIDPLHIEKKQREFHVYNMDGLIHIPANFFSS